MNARRAALCLAVLALVGAGEAHAQGKKSDSVVKASASADKPGADGKQVVTVTLTIDPKYHLYANPVGNEDLDSAKTEVKIASKGGKLEEVKLKYPRGKEEKDKVVGNYWIYEDKVTITGLVRRAKGDTGPLEVTVKYMTCNSVTKICLPPETVKLTVE